MENATKALLIAAAVLVAILIISLGLVVYNMAAETVGSVNLNEQEVQAHNEKFDRYKGVQKGTACNGMLNTVLTHNMSLDEDTEASKEVTVYKLPKSVTIDPANLATTLASATEMLNPDANTIANRFDTGATYNVTTYRDEDSNLVTTIIVQETK